MKLLKQNESLPATKIKTWLDSQTNAQWKSVCWISDHEKAVLLLGKVRIRTYLLRMLWEKTVLEKKNLPSPGVLSPWLLSRSLDWHFWGGLCETKSSALLGAARGVYHNLLCSKNCIWMVNNSNYEASDALSGHFQRREKKVSMAAIVICIAGATLDFSQEYLEGNGQLEEERFGQGEQDSSLNTCQSICISCETPS